MRFDAHHRNRLRDHVVRHLAREIVARRLQPGESLPSTPELALDFGMSRVVVREGIQELASYGMVRVQHGKRTVVLDPGQWNVLAPAIQQVYLELGGWPELTGQIFDVRLILEVNASGLAAEHATDEQLATLQRLADLMRAVAGGSGELVEFLRIDREFHETLSQASGNAVLRLVLRDLHDHVFAGWSASRIGPEHLPTLAAQHAEIAAALRRRDVSAARDAIEVHLRWAKDVETQGSDGVPQAAMQLAGWRP